MTALQIPCTVITETAGLSGAFEHFQKRHDLTLEKVVILLENQIEHLFSTLMDNWTHFK